MSILLGIHALETFRSLARFSPRPADPKLCWWPSGDYHLIKSNPPGFRFTGLTAEGPACIYHANGSVLAANMFEAGVVRGKANCS
eukprot:COSAG04_NODE_5312_length_1661_cov_1.316261_2_plen_85_part_00